MSQHAAPPIPAVTNRASGGRALPLARHYLRRSTWTGVLCALGAFLFQVMVVQGFASMRKSGAMRAAPALRRSMPAWLQQSLGIDGAEVGTYSTFLTVACQHPFLIVMVLAPVVVMLTAFLSGDSENRTLALVLTRPVGRLRLVMAALGATLLRLSVVVAASLTGVLISMGRVPPMQHVEWQKVVLVHANLFLFGAAAAALALLVSACFSSRGRAAGLVSGILLLMYATHFLVQVVTWLKPVSSLMLFYWYAPAQVIVFGNLPWQPLAVLSLATAVLAAAGVAIFVRRDQAL